MNTQLFIKNENKWIATDKLQKKLFATNENLKELQKNLKDLKIKDAVIMFVPHFNKTLAP